MKKTAYSGSNNQPTNNHYHPRTREAAGLLGFLGNVLLGMFGPLLGPLRCYIQGHHPEPFYKEGKYSIHTHRCSRCHATLGMGRMKWHTFGPPPYLPSLDRQITLDEWQNIDQPIEQEFRIYSQDQQEVFYYTKSKERVDRILLKRLYDTPPIPNFPKGGLAHIKETGDQEIILHPNRS